MSLLNICCSLQLHGLQLTRGSSQSRDQTCISCIGRQILYCWATREAFYRLWNIYIYIYIQLIFKLRTFLLTIYTLWNLLFKFNLYACVFSLSVSLMGLVWGCGFLFWVLVLLINCAYSQHFYFTLFFHLMLYYFFVCIKHFQVDLNVWFQHVV